MREERNFHNNCSGFEWQHRNVAKRNDLIQWFIICILAFYHNLSLMCVVCRLSFILVLYMTTDYVNIYPTTRTTRSHLLSFTPILWMNTFLAQHLKERGCFPNIVIRLYKILKFEKKKRRKYFWRQKQNNNNNKQTKTKTKRSRQWNGIIYLKDCWVLCFMMASSFEHSERQRFKRNTTTTMTTTTIMRLAKLSSMTNGQLRNERSLYSTLALMMRSKRV